MAYSDKIKKFGRSGFVPDGWYWLLPSKQLTKKKIKPVQFIEKNLVVYRGEDNLVRVLDAYCPHMGAHFCDGSVEGNDIRCPFHFWKFSGEGKCIEIPAMKDVSVPQVERVASYVCAEKYGLIWLWYGDQNNSIALPEIPELNGVELDFSLGKPFTKECHPNVMMINAIDVHHFMSVHNLIVDLNMEPKILSKNCIQFSNTTPLPNYWFLNWARPFYKKSLTYELTYWWGHTGSVMVGPDFLHCYIMFTLRSNSKGQAEGQTILITRKRKGLHGYLFSQVVLFLTKLVGNYFAKGDTLIFSRIRFNFKTPIKKDRAILHFIEHYENLIETGLKENKAIVASDLKSDLTV